MIGTVAGDFHDIGKNIVKMMLEGGGYEVVDLGVDVSPEAFVAAVREGDAALRADERAHHAHHGQHAPDHRGAEGAPVCASSVLIGIGGAPVTQKFADEIGADFYSADAYGCVEKCNQLLH